MSSGVKKLGNFVVEAAKNEVQIIKDTKRARQIAKSLYPDKRMAGTAVAVKKLTRDVGPEPVVGLILGTYTNPIPGLSVVGYLLGRGVAEGRKFVTKVIKGSVKSGNLNKMA